MIYLKFYIYFRFAYPSLLLRFLKWDLHRLWYGLTTVLQRNYNGLTLEVHTNKIPNIRYEHSGFHYSFFIYLARCYASSLDCLVDTANNSEEEDACCADGEGELCVTVALECWQWLVILVDEHSLHDQQIVVE